MLMALFWLYRSQSLPARGAWIEIKKIHLPRQLPGVAPRTGSVDRNQGGLSYEDYETAVAPRTGSVDRNYASIYKRSEVCVAPRTGSVDRNHSPATSAALWNGRSPHGERG